MDQFEEESTEQPWRAQDAFDKQHPELPPSAGKPPLNSEQRESCRLYFGAIARFVAATEAIEGDGISRAARLIVGRPHYKYSIAVVPPLQEVAPLLAAIRECEARPFRIISYEDESGKVFNCSFFTDEHQHMHSWISWLSENALSADGKFYECMSLAAAEGQPLPSPDTLLFGRGTEVLKDTRFGENLMGMAINFSRQVPVDHEQRGGRLR